MNSAPAVDESPGCCGKGQTASIGLIMEAIADPFYSGLSRAVEDVAHWNGSLLFTGSSDEDPQREQELALALCARRVDGLHRYPASGDHRYLLPTIAAGVARLRRPAGLAAPSADEELAGGQPLGANCAGVAHLVRHGDRRISGSSGTTRASTRPPSASRATEMR